MDKLRKREFKAKNGEIRSFLFREGTNDESCIIACFEEDVYGVLDKKFEENDVVIDLGGHIGSVSMLLSTIKPKLKIITVEALPENKSLITKNMELNNVKISLYHNLIVGEEKENKNIEIFYGDENTETGRCHKYIGTIIEDVTDNYKKTHNSVMIKSITLNSIFKNEYIKKCRLLKIDIEGAEKDIFTTMPLDVMEKIKEICGEWHWGNYKDMLPLLHNTFIDKTIGQHDFCVINKNFITEEI